MKNDRDDMTGDILLTIIIEETYSSALEVELQKAPDKPLVFIADGVHEHVDQFKQDLLSAIHKLIKGWHACEDIVFTVK